MLAAGEGTRLQSLTAEKPKGLVELAGKPILIWCLDELTELDVDEIIVVVGYHSEDIIRHYGYQYEDIPLVYESQEPLCGVADALLTANEYIDDTLILMYGDYIHGGDLHTVVEKHDSSNSAGTLFVEEVPMETARKHGICQFNDDGELDGIVEKPQKPPSNISVTGFYVFEPIIFSACRIIKPSDRGEYELPDTIDLLVYAGHHINIVYTNEWVVNINTTSDIDRVEEYLSDGTIFRSE